MIFPKSKAAQAFFASLYVLSLGAIATACGSSGSTSGASGNPGSDPTCAEFCAKLASLCASPASPQCGPACESANSVSQRRCVVNASTCGAAIECPGNASDDAGTKADTGTPAAPGKAGAKCTCSSDPLKACELSGNNSGCETGFSCVGAGDNGAAKGAQCTKKCTKDGSPQGVGCPVGVGCATVIVSGVTLGDFCSFR